MVDAIHGYRVVDQRSLPRVEGLRPCRSIVLVDRGPTSHQRYVTGLYCAGDDGWEWGHYFEKYDKAFDDFIDRFNRGY